MQPEPPWQNGKLSILPPGIDSEKARQASFELLLAGMLKNFPAPKSVDEAILRDALSSQEKV